MDGGKCWLGLPCCLCVSGKWRLFAKGCGLFVQICVGPEEHMKLKGRMAEEQALQNVGYGTTIISQATSIPGHISLYLQL